MKNAIDYIRKLPKPYNEMALKYGSNRTFYRKVGYASRAIYGLFVWANTDEGHDFWEAIHDNLKFLGK